MEKIQNGEGKKKGSSEAGEEEKQQGRSKRDEQKQETWERNSREVWEK